VERAYTPRLVDPLIAELLQDLPALHIVGPRATGKTTTAQRHARTVIRLDEPTEAVAFAADPDSALRGLGEPVLLDEWQAVPSVLGAVKRAVDADPHPGRFIVAGSVRADPLAEGWPGTGRLVRIDMTGLSVRETRGDIDGPSFVDRVAGAGTGTGDPGARLHVPPDPPDLRGYVELSLRSGFPEPALRLPERARRLWLDSYVEQLLTRDVEALGPTRDPERLRRYFEALALNTAGVVAGKTLYEVAGVNAKTADAYDHLLRNLLVVEAVPAWTTNRLKRLIRTAKRYVVDPGLVGAVLRLDVNGVMRDGDVLGRLLDTFVAAQLRAELPVSVTRPRMYHLRQDNGRHEVDLIAELGADRVVAIEVKASSAPDAEASRHLRWLRDSLGDRFVAGVVLHTGRRIFRMDEGIIAAPIGTLWG
jgi:predicted AAA+ superfamily ATPase